MSYGCTLSRHQKVNPSRDVPYIKNIPQTLVDEANSGNGQSCFKLAKMLIDGYYTYDPIQGEYYLNKSIEKDYLDSYIYYAQLLHNGTRIHKNDKKAEKYYKLANKKGILEAPSLLAEYYFETKQKKKALKILEKSIQKGNAKSLLYYSQLCQHGILVKKDIEKSIELLEKASNTGDNESMYKYAEFLREDKNCKQNLKSAFSIHKQNSEKNYIPSILSYAQMLENGEGTEKNLVEAAKQYKIAADKNDDVACLRISDMFFNGEEGVEMSITEGYKYLKKAVDNENPEALYKMAKRIMNNDENQALKYFRKAAILDHTESGFICGNFFLERGKYKMAISYYYIAANKGNIESALMLGISYLFDGNIIKIKESYEIFSKYKNENLAKIGLKILYKLLKHNEKLKEEIGINLNEQEIKSLIPLIKCYSNDYFIDEIKKYIDKNEDHYLQRISNPSLNDSLSDAKRKYDQNKSPASLCNYGKRILFGLGCDPDPVKALPLIKEASDAKNNEAMFLMGLIYLKGEFIDKDLIESLNLFEQAAKSNNVEAMFFCGSVYFNKIDYEKAAFYFKMAADFDDIPSMFIYANMNENGIGIYKNEKEAAKYYFKAAQFENVESMTKYANLCSEGKGVTKNEEEAFKWNKKAKNNQYYYQIIKGETSECNKNNGNVNNGNVNNGNVNNGNDNDESVNNENDDDDIDKRGAFNILEKRSSCDPSATYLLGCCYENGFCCDKDMTIAIDKFKDAANKGDEDAKLKIVELKEKGLIEKEYKIYDKTFNPYESFLTAKKLLKTNKEDKEGLRLLKKCVDKNQPNAMIKYAQILLSKKDGPDGIIESESSKGLILLREASKLIPKSINLISFDNSWDSIRYKSYINLNMHFDSYGGNDGIFDSMDWIPIIADLLFNSLEQNIDGIQFIPGKGMGTTTRSFSITKQLVLLVCLRLGFDCFIDPSNDGNVNCKINSFHNLEDEYLDFILNSNNIETNNGAYLAIKNKYPTMPDKCIDIICSVRDDNEAIQFADEFENKLDFKKYEIRKQKIISSKNEKKSNQSDKLKEMISNLKKMIDLNVIRSTYNRKRKFTPIIKLDIRDVPEKVAHDAIKQIMLYVKDQEFFQIQLLLPLNADDNYINNLKAFYDDQVNQIGFRHHLFYINTIRYLDMSQIFLTLIN